MFAPLGGAGEIGMNLALYGLGNERQRQWIAVDLRGCVCGRRPSGRRSHPAGCRFLIEERRNILGIVLTHAHEDHFGALIDLSPRLRLPIYATPFTAALLEAKRLSEPGAPDVPVNVVAAQQPLSPRARSTSSMCRWLTRSRNRTALIIRTPLGAVLHTGDWKIDPTPVNRSADRRSRALARLATTAVSR